MKKISLVFLLSLVAFVFASCSVANESSSNMNANTVSYSSQPSSSTANRSSGGGIGSGSGNGGGGGGGGRENPAGVKQQVSLEQADKIQTEPAVTEKKIIRNAEMTLETESPDETLNKITAIAESKGGFVIESQRQTSDVKATKTDLVTMTVRVPSGKFDESLNEIRKAASRIIIEDVKGQDVTEEFIDIEARLKTQKALEAQFLEIMKQAKTVEDALNVQREIADVRGEIEKIEGRKKFLENQSAFSTIKIRLQTATTLSPNSSGFFYQVRDAFSSGFSVALNFILGLITILIALLPFLVLIVLPTYLLIRYFVKKSRRHKLASEIAEAEIKNE